MEVLTGWVGSPMQTTRTCLSCGKAVKGRSDKKFCDDYCRNQYHNLSNTGDNEYVRSITNALKKNRRILQELLPETEETAKGHKEVLIDRGFRFKYITHTYTTRKGCTYFYCFDYGYLPLEGDRVLIVRKKEA